jgi:hypothetical protein
MHSWVTFGTLTSTDRSEVPVRSSPLVHFSGLVTTLLLVAVLAAGCNGDKKTASTATAPQLTTTAPTTTTNTVPPPPPAPTGTTKRGKLPPGGRLLIGTRDLYPFLAGRIASYAPQQVTGEGVRILSIASPTAIWVGKNPQERLLVSLRLKGEGGPKLKPGKKATFVGALLPAAGKESSFGLKGNDRLKLVSQGAYLDVSAADFHTK